MTENATLIAEHNGELILQLNTSIQSLSGLVDTRTLQLLNQTGQILLIVTANGEVLAGVSANITQLTSLLVQANATITGLIQSSTGQLAALISTANGTIVADLRALHQVLEEIGYNITVIKGLGEDIMNSTLTIRSTLGTLNLTTQEAMTQLGIIKGVVQQINTTAHGVQLGLATAEVNITVRLQNLNAPPSQSRQWGSNTQHKHGNSNNRPRQPRSPGNNTPTTIKPDPPANTGSTGHPKHYSREDKQPAEPATTGPYKR
ncbi:MAG: hypothetical protein F7C35_07555 [Desulfurococcales archaeon]|nr:hypothetical protein [Desulfurococcales archaeon]